MSLPILLAMVVAAQSGTLSMADAEGRRGYAGTVSAGVLLRDYMGPKRPRDDPFLMGSDLLNQQMARGYMNGIKDATEGAAWCYVSGKPHELNDDIAAALMKLNAKQLQGRAAPLVVDALRRRFPCPHSRRSP
jgi:opacity protein-like surface antigen